MKRFLILLSALILLGATANAQQKYKAYVVSNAHFDTQWNWTVQTSIDQYVKKTITQNLYLLDTYPEYIFNFEGGIKYYWMKEYYPEYYERVKDYILKGRWHITGSTWDANDPNMPSTESFIRNVMYGQHYYRDEFGPQFMSKDIFLPDCFGFGYTLPTVAAHCGLTGFSTQKLQWRENAFFPDGKKIPFPIGLWKGVDGSQILGCLDARSYGQRWNEDISYNQDLIDLAASSSLGIAYRYYGTGDTGGSPSIASVESVIKGSKSDGPVKIIIAGSDQIMEDFYPFENHPELPVYDGELLQDVHATGCYTSQAAMKRFNRRNEQLGDAAERASVVADWFGGLSYQKQTIDDAWKRVIWHQFHDDLTGTSTPYVYQFSWNDEIISETQFADVITAATGAVSQALATNVKGSPVVVYNPVGYQRSDIVTAKVPFASRPAGVAVYGPDGKSVPAQLVDYADGEATVIFAANVKPVSFSVYDVRSSSAKKGSLKVTNNTIENAVYRLTLDANGDIASLYDKRNNKEIVEGGKALRLAFFEENKSVKWPAWEIKKDMIDKTPVAITGNVKTTVVENGPVRATIKVERTKDGSNFVQYISLTSGTYEDRVVVKNEFDWNSSGKLLKAEFPFSFSNPNATYDLGIGSVERGNNKINAYEVIGHQWADITASDGSYGVSIMNDCKYGWDKPADNTIRLTLLHTPETERSYVYQNQNDLGHHTFTYAIVGHKGNYHEGGTVKNAESLNQPLMAFNTTKHSGSLGREFAMVKNVDPSLAFRAFKKAQDGKSYIVRVYESAGKGVNGAAVTFNAEIESAREVNGIEEDKGAAKFSGNTLYV
ncbi:MAG: alpha-mannosidase, partial [Prevotella sp.]|nr:alpha-mannosidase [Candidatus Equicola stercoris]